MELYCQELKVDHAQAGSEAGWIQDQVGFCKIYLQKPIHTVIKENIFADVTEVLCKKRSLAH